MKSMRAFILRCTIPSILILLLCQCATKHQPVEFPEYFYSRPKTHFDPNKLIETRELAAREDLTTLERVHLLHLLQNELKGLRRGSARFAELNARTQKLQWDLRALRERWVEMKLELLQERADERKLSVKAPDYSPSGPYHQARELWNADKNILALRRLRKWMRTRSFHRRTSGSLKTRAYYMRFRIALDLNNYSLANESYEALLRIHRCGVRTASAGFITALLAHSYGNSKRALSILEKKCDPDKSPERRLRDKYWKAMFLKKDDPATSEALLQEVATAQIPSYYNFLAQNRLGQAYWADTSSQRSYLWSEFKTSEVDHMAFLQAESLLRAQLRSEASLYLRQIASRLKGGNTRSQVRPLLYAANLFKASGEHLEALRIYYQIASDIRESPFAKEDWFQVNFIQDMFARPFPKNVEWISKMWKVDPDYVYSIMRQESAFSPTAVSGAKAQGLMQMMPFLSGGLSEQWGYEAYYRDRYMLTREENLKLAIFHLYQLKSHAPHPALMAAAYNAGLHRARNWWRRYRRYPLDVFVELIPIKETRNYVMLVLRNYIYYKVLKTGQPVNKSLFALNLPALRK